MDRTGVLFDSGTRGGHETGRATPESGAGGKDRLSDLLNRASGIHSGLPYEANDVEDAGKDVGENGSLSGVWFAEPGGVFDAATGLVSIAALSLSGQDKGFRRSFGGPCGVSRRENRSLGHERDECHRWERKD